MSDDTTAETETEDSQHRIQVGETAEGDPVTLPVIEVLTGRGFATGKSGAGKSNTVSVVIEELLECGFPVLVVDTDGEYYGLKEEYELLHAGADEECDIQVSPEHAEKLASLALDENVPIILDVSGYLDDDAASDLIRETARHLFAREKKLKKPFLLVVEECHEYIPEGGGMDETGRMLIKVGKRGRKHGLGIVGISQRPADVKKDFITQANWLVWHRLTWENDTDVVRRIVGSEYGDAVSDLDAGEAFVQTDWTDHGVRRVQFKRKRTFDAGATPGLDDVDRPELKSVSDGLVDDLAAITDRQQREEERVAELEVELERRDERIAELEDELADARDVSRAARQMADALADAVPAGYQTQLPADQWPDGEPADEEGTADEDGGGAGADDGGTDGGEEGDDGAAEGDDEDATADADGEGEPDGMGDPDGEELAAIRDRVAELEAALDRAETAASTDASATASDARSAESGARTADSSAAGDETSEGAATAGAASDDGEHDGAERAGDDELGTYLSALREKGQRLLDGADATRADGPAVDAGATSAGANGEPDAGGGEHDTEAGARDAGAGAPDVERDDPGDSRGPGAGSGAELAALLDATPVAVRIEGARRESRCNEAHAESVVAALREGPRTVQAIAREREPSVAQVQSLLSELRARSLVTRDDELRYAFDREAVAGMVADADPRAELGELYEQWRVE